MIKNHKNSKCDDNFMIKNHKNSKCRDNFDV